MEQKSTQACLTQTNQGTERHPSSAEPQSLPNQLQAHPRKGTNEVEPRHSRLNVELLQGAGWNSPFPNAADPGPTPCNVVFCKRGCLRFAHMQFSPRSRKLCNGMTLVCCALGCFYMYHQADHTSYQESASKEALCLLTPALLLTFWNGFILQGSLSLPAPRDGGFGCQRLLQLCTSGYSSPGKPVS